MVAILRSAADWEFYLRATEEARPAVSGRWWNPYGLFATLPERPCRDGEAVDPEHLLLLLEGFSPDGETRLRRISSSPVRASGLDIAFIADKSLSAVRATADSAQRVRIEEAQDAAVRTAMRDVFARCCVVAQRRASRRELHGGCILGALFPRFDSPAGHPHLHTHAVVFNLVQSEVDGRWHSLDPQSWRKWVIAAGAVYRDVLAEGLTSAAGLHIERHGERGEFFRVAGVSQNLLDLWSEGEVGDGTWHSPESGEQELW